MIAIFVGLISFSSTAQVNPHAIGVRLGGGVYGNGLEISYQHGVSDMNRLEFDLGWTYGKYNNEIGYGSNYSRIVISGIYHWDWNLTEGLNWYVGPGAQIGYWDYKYNTTDYNDQVTIGIGGQIGLEYDFNNHGAPILLSLDTRPMWGVIGPTYYRSFGYGAALGIRYTF